MEELGRLEDLPLEYRQELLKQNLVPLWPSLRGVLPPKIPTRQTKPICWEYTAIRPLLMEAGDLAPIEKAERRVLVLANPGHGIEKMQASSAIYLGMQLLLPGEYAASHRHTPNAVRMIVEGEGAYTTVDGDKLQMHRGDLILTPTGLWHEHGHEGQEPVIWLDVLDLPIVYYMETSYHEEGKSQNVSNGQLSELYVHGGVLPTSLNPKSNSQYPMLRYAWKDVRASLEMMAKQDPLVEVLQVTYVNPLTGHDAENILGFYALMLRPDQTLTLPARSPASVYHVIEGEISVHIAAEQFKLSIADTCCAPGYTPVTLKNHSATEPACIFMVDEAPLHRKLGVYEVR